MMTSAHCLKGARLATGITGFSGVADLVFFLHLAYCLSLSWTLRARDDHQTLTRRKPVSLRALVCPSSQWYCQMISNY